MSAESASLAGRRAAERLMRSTCEVTAKPDEPATDPETGEVVAAAGAVVYTGKCKVRSGGGGPVDVGGVEAFTYDLEVSLPFEVAVVTAGMGVHVLTSRDPSLVGVRAEVQRVKHHDYGTDRRLFCAEAT